MAMLEGTGAGVWGAGALMAEANHSSARATRIPAALRAFLAASAWQASDLAPSRELAGALTYLQSFVITFASLASM